MKIISLVVIGLILVTFAENSFASSKKVMAVLDNLAKTIDKTRQQNANLSYVKFQMYAKFNITQIKKKYQSAYGIVLLREAKEICHWSLGRKNDIKFMDNFDMILLVDKSPGEQEKIIEDLKEKAEYCHNNFQSSK